MKANRCMQCHSIVCTPTQAYDGPLLSACPRTLFVSETVTGFLRIHLSRSVLKIQLSNHHQSTQRHRLHVMERVNSMHNDLEPSIGQGPSATVGSSMFEAKPSTFSLTHRSWRRAGASSSLQTCRPTILSCLTASSWADRSTWLKLSPRAWSASLWVELGPMTALFRQLLRPLHRLKNPKPGLGLKSGPC